MLVAHHQDSSNIRGVALIFLGEIEGDRKLVLEYVSMYVFLALFVS